MNRFRQLRRDVPTFLLGLLALTPMLTPAPTAGAAARPQARRSQKRPRPEPSWPYPSLHGQRPLLIAHRGASGERPEHTLAAYERAIDLGADYIEPDLAITRDGVLIARHEHELSATTDVARRAEFAARRRTQIVDGRSVTGWFSEDFTLAEIKRLRAVERWPQLRPLSAAHDGRYRVPTLQEVIDLVRAKEKQSGRPGWRIGLYPETKYAAHFARLGLPVERTLAQLLTGHGYRNPQDPVFIQSFEPTSLQRLSDLTQLPLVQLIDERGAPPDLAAAQFNAARSFADLLTPAGLLEVSAYASAIGVAKGWVIARDSDGKLGAATDLVERAHGLGLAVHVWTFRNEDRFLPSDARGAPHKELERFLRTGIDGFFTDYPATGAAVLRKLGAPK